MKTRLITLTTILFLATVSAFAQTADNKNDAICKITVLNSIETKEYIINDKRTDRPIKKKVYISDTCGKKLETVVYLWERSRAWVSYKKTEYKYDDNDILYKIVHMKWNDINSVWSDAKEQNVTPNKKATNDIVNE